MNTTTDNTSKREIYSVSRLVRETRSVLEGSFPLIWVSGEISNLAQPASGHIYFSLKDEIAQVRCAMFRMKRQKLRFRPDNGQQVVLRARVSLYEARGEFQLIVEHMEPAGEGALRLAFEQLKQKLAAEGLFDAAHKKPLPSIPQQLGIITSPSGAAIRDLLTVLQRRFPALPVIIYPVQVQGDGAAEQITAMLQLADRRDECDLLILSRGGGSLEDLQAFNDEGLARAIHACRIPLVTGIGHEIDFTIADFVADQRAATPSAAAELVSPDQSAWLRQLQQLGQRLGLGQRRHLGHLQEQLLMLRRRLLGQHPSQRLQQRSQRFDELSQRLRQAQQLKLVTLGHRLEKLLSRLSRLSPRQRIDEQRFRYRLNGERLQQAMERRLKDSQTRLNQLARDLHTLSPLNTLNRGYAIVSREADGRIVRSDSEVERGDRVNARLSQGRLVCRVEEKDS
ncbi:MAG: exodeoxyribonuclease VII large subunit [gamma proteobacterium symbiont of Ctena orbiculata]|uniref:Exodeoxyribonuclease 7 large subunit n=1 Tax=Candidatus Thiodiazotropha taylori TaxID=2792791 RepID=A0A944QT79_9GAMM|nr:exodeoxyribonuclease VII large subunit [Candidatus Thiodiazotropha taylori]PUB89345.1 MAG: exodeoxyribonuclease VII large subunit [gamma proteobacterium symbiont of Ctena orbiculata]MBT2987664.1 exodeoxyribonuclease VII large subunit [Candidatus Thiodiazotropha taylori]MBT2995081.1 exodeoxyribonuclease VII large subunit [Candidatus Thiodiazotropha taylori]MBT3000000.1 exodeoxyribonuclease VII large subunit [Candidatus Thiodiazotropha taylori]